MRRALMALGLASLVAAAPASAAVDVAQTSVSSPPKRLIEGKAFTVRDTVRGRARRAVVRYYLSRDRRRDAADIRLIGSRRLARASAKTRVTVPYAIPDGGFHLLACADDARALRERSEKNNCRASRKTTRIAERPRDAASAVSALSDLSSIPDDDASLMRITGFNRLTCPPRLGDRVGHPAALRRLEALLDSAPGARLAYRRSSAHRSAEGAEADGFVALSAGSPGGSLATLLRAHRLEPRQPRHLVNAAAMAATLGRPAEALALLDRADTLNAGRSAPFGLNQQAVALNARGFALLQLGRFAEAQAALGSAVDLEPLLSEAKVNLAAARTCGGDQLGSQRILRAGQHRESSYDDNPQGGDPIKGKPPAQVLDLSAGKGAKLPDLRLPGTFSQAFAMQGYYGGVMATKDVRHQARQARERELGQGTPPPTTDASVRRASAIMQLVWRADSDPTVAAARDRFTTESRRVSDAQHIARLGRAAERWQREADAACTGRPQYSACFDKVYWEKCQPESEGLHAAWRADMSALKAAGDAYVDAYHRYATALMANLADPGTHQVMADDREALIDLQFYGLVQRAVVWSANADVCKEPLPPDLGENPDMTLPGAEKCPPWLRALRFRWKWKGGRAEPGKPAPKSPPWEAEIEVNCERVKVEIGGAVLGLMDYAWLGAFAQLEYSPHTGKTTVFAGPKAGANIPGSKFGGSMKDGVYVTFDANGDVDDVGLRFATDAGASTNPVSIKGGETMDFSFVPVFGPSD